MAAENVFSAAIDSGNLETFQQSINLYPYCLNSMRDALEGTAFKTTALIEVIQKAPSEKKIAMATLILLHPVTNLEEEDGNGNTALVWAELLENEAMVHLFRIHAGAPPRERASPAQVGR